MEEPKQEQPLGDATPGKADGGVNGGAAGVPSNPAPKKGMKNWEKGAAVGILILAVYGFAYMFAMETEESEVSTGGPMFTLRRPYFSRNAETDVTLQKIFRPALLIDSKIRPGYWGLPPELNLPEQ